MYIPLFWTIDELDLGSILTVSLLCFFLRVGQHWQRNLSPLTSEKPVAREDKPITEEEKSVARDIVHKNEGVWSRESEKQQLFDWFYKQNIVLEIGIPKIGPQTIPYVSV